MTFTSWLWRRWWKPGYVLGALTCLVLSLVFSLDRIKSFPNPSPPAALGTYTPVVLATAFVLLLVAAIGPRGRSVGAGFLVTLLVLTIVSGGGCTSRWADPVAYNVQEIRWSLRDRRFAAQAEATEMRWRDSVRRSGLSANWGAWRTLMMRRCLQVYADSSSRMPPDSLSIPSYGGLCRSPEAFHQGPQRGYTTRYVPPAAGADYRLITTPLSVLALAGPIIELDERGIVTKRDSAQAPAYASFSPVATMHALRACLDSAFAAAGTPPPTVHDLVQSRRSPCAPLGLTPYYGPSEARRTDENAVRVSLPVGAYGVEVVAFYILEYVPIGARFPRKFDLHARPHHFPSTGLRSYLLTAAGALHATSENRAATPADPGPLECESSVRVACWR